MSMHFSTSGRVVVVVQSKMDSTFKPYAGLICYRMVIGQ